MATNGVDGLAPFRASSRHRLTRSIPESGSPSASARLLFGQMGNSISAGSGQHHQKRPYLQFQYPQQERSDDCAVPAATAATMTSCSARGSLDLARSEGVSPYQTPNRTPSHSRRTSMLTDSNADETRTMASPQSHVVRRRATTFGAATPATAPGISLTSASATATATARVTMPGGESEHELTRERVAYVAACLMYRAHTCIMLLTAGAQVA